MRELSNREGLEQSLRAFGVRAAPYVPTLYVIWAGVWTLSSALAFYRAMLQQTGGEWSAPLDDVFIHFDYARETAHGHPFQWATGNGYSSGNTSILYPFVLAIGWLLGFTGERMMIWAAIIAAVCVFGTLLAVRRLLVPAPSPDVRVSGGRSEGLTDIDLASTQKRTGAYAHAMAFLFPPAFLAIGALDWSLWSGMEVAVYLAAWALALIPTLAIERSRDPAEARLWSYFLAGAGAILVLTRPEGASTLGAFGLFAVALTAKRFGLKASVVNLLIMAAPAVFLLAGQAVLNRALTGESSANGAIVKLAINSPFMTAEEKKADWLFNLSYTIFRNLEYHFTDASVWSFLVPALAGCSLAFRSVRRYGVLLAVQITGWLLLVALNGQVRWQNERYTMPAVAWLLIMAVLGVVGLVGLEKRPSAKQLALVASTVIAVVGLGSLHIVSDALATFGAATGRAMKAILARWEETPISMTMLGFALVAITLGLHYRPRPASRSAERPLDAASPWVILLVGAICVQLVGIATRAGGTLPEFRLPWSFALLGGAIASAALVLWPARLVTAVVALALFEQHQVDKVRDQKWFFARASRNIRDQHLVAGRWLAEIKPSRILVGDAGALIYASGAKGLDIIGLGGFHDLPFARAGVHGLAATLELIERMPPSERPDVMAIYPTWWGVLPTWFTSGVLARFPVEGNVICGGYEDVIYKADWSVLGTGDRPRSVPSGESVKDGVDIADLVSERAHTYRFPQPQGGFTDMKILPDPSAPNRDMFDGGRRISPGRSERFVVGNLRAGKSAHLLVRSNPEQTTTIEVRVSGRRSEGLTDTEARVAGAAVANVQFARTEGWVEQIVDLPASVVTRTSLEVELANVGANDFIDHHVWVTQ